VFGVLKDHTDPGFSSRTAGFPFFALLAVLDAKRADCSAAAITFSRPKFEFLSPRAIG
jgi:hypothetical protein